MSRISSSNKRHNEKRFQKHRQRQQQNKKKYISYKNKKKFAHHNENVNEHDKCTVVDMYGNNYEGSFRNKYVINGKEWEVMYNVNPQQRNCGYWNNGLYFLVFLLFISVIVFSL